MRNFQGMILKWIRTYMEIFKSALVYLKIEHDSFLAAGGCECNYMKLSLDKCHLLILGHKYESVWVNIGSSKFGQTMIKNFLESTLIAI